MTKLNNRTFGRIGEDAVIEFMERRGYKIVTANYNTGYGELDIVAIKRGVLVFTEVKTKHNERFCRVIDELTDKKMASVKRAAYFFRRWDGTNREVAFFPFGKTYLRYTRKYKKYRFDFAEVIINDGVKRIIYTKDAF